MGRLRPTIPFWRDAVTSLVPACLMLASCGGGGSASPAPPPPGLAESLRYSTPQVFVVGTAIAPLAPAVKGVQGKLTGFSCAALPPGLVVDSSTGVISGRPTTVEPAASYTISAADPNGNAVSTDINITVNAVGPGTISYGASAFTFTAGIPGRKLTPQAADTVTGWSIAPQLPPGLTFNTVDGSISGTPAAASRRTPYTVTGQGSKGPLSATVAIEVDTDVVVDLGHNASIRVLQFNGSTVLSEDVNDRWVLWDYRTGAMIASGDAAYGDCLNCGYPVPGTPAALAGPTAVIGMQSGLQVRSAASGAVMANISLTQSWWNLATDGSYVVAGDMTSLGVWSPSGQLLISRPGNYANAYNSNFASPGAVHIINGPAGANVLETISVPSGADVISPKFKGQFVSWFLDGSGFFSVDYSSQPYALLVYSDSVVQEASLVNAPFNNGSGGEPPSAGTYVQGAWVWTFSPVPSEMTLSVYPLASPTAPVATYTFGSGAVAMPSASVIGVWDPTTAKLSVIDLSGATPVKVDYTSPFGIADIVETFAAISASNWLGGYASGVLLDGASLPGTPRFLDYGGSFSVAGSANRIAIATASGRILYFNAVTLAQEGTILSSSDTSPYPAIDSKIGSVAGPQLELSSDGTILAVLARGGVSVDIYSLPSGSLLYSWPYWPLGSLLPESIALSGSGTVLGINSPNLMLGGLTQMASPSTGGAPIFSVHTFLPPLQATQTTQGTPQLRLSPDGERIAASLYGPDTQVLLTPLETNILSQGYMVPFVPGWPVGWIDDTHLLVNSYITDAARQVAYAGCTIYDLNGIATGTCALPEELKFQTVDSDTLFALNPAVVAGSPIDQPEIASISTGTVSWVSGDSLPDVGNFLVGPTFQAALAGNHVALVTDSRLVAQSY